MNIVEITEYDHFVSFVVEGDDGKRAHVQFRHEQLSQWNGEWTIGSDTTPFHVAALTPARKIRVSAELALALAVAIAGLL